MTEELESAVEKAVVLLLAKDRVTGHDANYHDILKHLSEDEQQFENLDHVFSEVVYGMKNHGRVVYDENYDGTEGENYFEGLRLTELGRRHYSSILDPDAVPPVQGPLISLSGGQVSIGTMNIQTAGNNSTQSIHQVIDNSQFSQTLNEIEKAVETLPMGDANRTEAKGLIASLRGYAGRALDATGRAIASALSALLTAAGSTLGKSLLVACGIAAA